jgi:hypothetical protein
MNDVVFVMTNSKLLKKKKNRKVVDCEIEFDEIDSDNEWIVEDEGSDENEILDFTIEEDEVGGIGGTQDEDDGAVPNEDECEMHNLDDDIEGEEDDMEDMGVGIDENLLKDLMN